MDSKIKETINNQSEKNGMKSKKKKILFWSLISLVVAIVLAGVIVGICLLSRPNSNQTDPVEKFKEDIVENNISSSNINSQDVILPDSTKIENVYYIDNNYIIVEDNDGNQIIYVRNELLGSPVRIDKFKIDEASDLTYNKVETIFDDYAKVCNSEQNKTYIVNLKSVEVIAESTNYAEFEIRNNILFMYSELVDDYGGFYYIFKVVDINSKVGVLNLEKDDNIYNFQFTDESLVIFSDNKSIVYSYKIEGRELVKKFDISLEESRYVDSDYTPNNGEIVIDTEGGKKVITEISYIIAQNEEYLLIESRKPTADYTKANYKIIEDYYEITYYSYNIHTNSKTKLDLDCHIESVNDSFNIDGYYSLIVSANSIFDREWKETYQNLKYNCVIVDITYNEVFKYDKSEYGDIIYTDGENFLTTGVNANIIDANGNTLDIIDSDIYWIDSINSWNGLFIIEGVSGYGISDMQGNVIASNDFEKISPLIDGYAVGYYNGHYYQLDLTNKIGKLIKNYDTKYDILAFAGAGMYVTSNSNNKTLYCFDGTPVNNNENLNKINILEFDLLKKQVNILLEYDNGKTVFVSAGFIDSSLAQKYNACKYNSIEIDELVTAEEILQTLNISELSTFSKIEEEIEEEVVKNTSSSDAVPASEFIGENNGIFTSSPHSKIERIQSQYSSKENYKHCDTNLKLKYSNFTSGRFFSLSELTSGATNLGLFLNVNNNKNSVNDFIEQLLPPMNYSNGTISTNLYTNALETHPEYGATNTFVGAKIYLYETSAVVAISLIKHVSEDYGTHYSLYISSYFTKGITISELKVVENKNDKNIATSLKEDIGYVDHFKNLMELGNPTYELVNESNNAGYLVNGSINYSSISNSNYYKVGSITLNNGLVMYGFGFSRDVSIALVKDIVNKTSKPDVTPSLYFCYNNYKYSSSADFTVSIKFGVVPNSASYTLFETDNATVKNYVDNLQDNQYTRSGTIDTKFYRVKLDGRGLKITPTFGYEIVSVSFTPYFYGTYGGDLMWSTHDEVKITEPDWESYDEWEIYIYDYDNLWYKYRACYHQQYFSCDRLRDICVTVKPKVNKITYSSINKINNEILSEYTIYYGIAPTSDYQPDIHEMAGSSSSTDNSQGCLLFGLGACGALTASAFESLVYNLPNYWYFGYYHLDDGGYGDRYPSYVENYSYDDDWNLIIENELYCYKLKNNPSLKADVKFSGSTTAGSLTGGYKAIYDSFYTSDNYDLYVTTYWMPDEFNVTVYLTDGMNTHISDGYLKASDDNGNTIEMVKGTDFTGSGNTYSFSFKQYYEEPLIDALKRTLGNSQGTELQKLFSESDNLLTFKTPTHYSTGWHTYRKSTGTIIEEIDKNYADQLSDYYILISWDYYEFTMNFNTNISSYGLAGANLLNSNNASLDSKTKLRVDVDNVNIPYLYGFTGNSDKYTNVMKFKGWYLTSELNPSEDNLVYGLASDNPSVFEFKNESGKLLDSDDDKIIYLYAHYDTIENTKFTYDINVKNSSGSYLTNTELKNNYGFKMDVTHESDSGTRTGLETKDYSIESLQNGYIEISINLDSKYYVSKITLSIFNCNDRSSTANIKHDGEFIITRNEYLDLYYIEFSNGKQYTLSGVASGTGTVYTNSDSRFAIEYIEDVLTIKIKTGIGKISENCEYYGGSIEIELTDKLYNGGVEVS